MAVQEHAITVDDLWFRYPTATDPTLCGLSFVIHEGEFVGIMGPSGAGKSTLCQALKGLIPHTTPGEVEGTVTVFGRDVTAEANSIEGARVGLVLQDPEAQIIGMTVREDLAFGPENYEVDPEEIARRSVVCLEAVGLSGLMDRDTYTLSGGQKQRLAIASALMLEPDVLVLDEPTSELDPLGKDQVFEILESLRALRTITVIVIEHEVDRLARLADRIIVIDHGEIVADGTPLDVLGTPGARERTAGERLPAAADFSLDLLDRGFPPAQPTLVLADAIANVTRVLERIAK